MAKEVKIYTTPSCVYCKMTKEMFQKNSVEYKEMNVAADQAAREEMVSKSGQLGVPVIDIGGEIVIGFDELRLKELLEIKA
ncbi:NrdH-redoxin [Candidatus Giovannonibacteria bacterium RIFCSPLOWO2_01_FULL_46_13]|uniref:NrdH-redoxin n=1 Tax=Candidatus Giovannonibacteria bacterium RIFCSPLOWO2_01_FULL_46_13 TaxID=1798352 RepID=A0A1F5X561_9BACT|nr:MAG: NrdH-redoxin [Candidatus Giovannonibacteria bacterium RIFCSPLOWO2_01_FULL_46_13]